MERAVEQEKITGGGGIQAELDRILKLDEFRVILRQELAARGVKEKDVSRCMRIIYPVLSRYAHGNDGDIVLRGLYHPDNELAGLVALMRVQGGWRNPLKWRVVAAEPISYTGGIPTINQEAPSTPPPLTQVQTTGQRASSKAQDPQPKKARKV